MIFSLVSVTMASFYVVVNHFTFLGGEIKTEVMKIQVTELTAKLRETQGYLEEVHARDVALRTILELKGKPKTYLHGFLGGPNPEDESRLQRLMNRNHGIDVSDLNDQLDTLNKEINSRLASITDIDKNIEYQRLMYRAIPNVTPCGGAIGSGFGMRLHPFTKRYEFHNAVDIAGSFADPIYASADGEVVETDWVGNYGRLVVLRHNFGYETRYAHLSRILCYKGQRVKRGQKIGLMGETGRATCVHLHYEVRHNGNVENPRLYMNPNFFFSRRFKPLG